nr:hypothetical protein C4D60_Mb03t02670 [Ipomoea batatas]
MLINTPAICPDLSLVSSQGAYISHPNHGLRKAVKELALAVPKPVNYGHRVGSGGGKQFLVGLEKSLVVLQVGEVVAVEAVGRGGIKICHGFQKGWESRWCRHGSPSCYLFAPSERPMTDLLPVSSTENIIIMYFPFCPNGDRNLRGNGYNIST